MPSTRVAPHARLVALVGVILTAAAVSCGSPSDSYRRRGLLYAQQGKLDEAIQELRLAVAAEPRDAKAHAALGRLELKAGRPGAALRELDRAYYYGDGGVKRELARLLVDRGRARAPRGEINRWRDFDRAKRLDPSLRREIAAELTVARADADRARSRAADTRGGSGAGTASASGTGDVEDLLAAATAAWLAGERDAWIDAPLAAELLRLAGNRPADDLATWARPTIHRLHGEKGRVGDAIAAAGEPTGVGRAVLALEAALAGDLDDAKRLATPAAAVDGGLPVLLAALTIGNLTGNPVPELYTLAAASPEGAEALARRGEVAPLLATRGAHVEIERRAARWWLLLGQLPPGAAQPILARWRKLVDADALAAWQEAADGGRAEDLGSPARALPPPWASCPDTPERCEQLGEVARAIARDLARGDRRAREYVDLDVAPTCRAGDVFHLFAAAGDTRRALVWGTEILSLEPAEWRASLLAAQVTARAHDAPRAAQYLVDAEYWAPARGLPSMTLSRTYAETGLAIEAIGAARQALALADAPLRDAAAEHLVAASLTAGRTRDAQSVWNQILAKLPAAQMLAARDRIRARLADAGGASASIAWLDATATPPISSDLRAWVDSVPGDVTSALAVAAADEPTAAAALLDQTLRWSGRSVAARLARARLEDKGSPRRLELMAELLLIGILDDSERGADALDGFAELADTEGKSTLATAARTEATALRRFTR